MVSSLKGIGGLNDEAISDILIEAFRNFHRAAQRLVKDPGPAPFIMKLVKDARVDYIRDQPAEEVPYGGPAELDRALSMALDNGLYDTDPLDQLCNMHTQDPLTLLIEAEERESACSLAEAELKTLVPNDDHRLIYLLAVDDMPYATIAEKFEMPVRTVEDIVHRVRTRMKGYLGGQ